MHGIDSAGRLATTPLRIAIVYSVPTQRARSRRYRASDEDTLVSAEEIHQALRLIGMDPVLAPIDEHSIESIGDIAADCIFNLIEWDGLDLDLAGRAFDVLDRQGVPYTGASKDNYLLTTNKLTLKQAFGANHIPTPRWQTFSSGHEVMSRDLMFPVIVKPSLEHCSIGLGQDSVSEDREAVAATIRRTLSEFQQPVIAEEFIQGREFQVTVLERNGRPEVLPAAEIVFDSTDGNGYLTFESRWDATHPDYEKSTVQLARFDAALRQKLTDLSIRAFQRLRFRDYCRLDVRLREDEFYVLEANANPGLGDSDDYGMTVSYKSVGMTFSDVVRAIVTSSLHRRGAGRM